MIPGKVRTYSVGVASYRGAPAEDCEHLVRQLAEWLESDTFKSDDPEIQFALSVASSVYAHLYIAWIRPFGDGNGRTARLLACRGEPDPTDRTVPGVRDPGSNDVIISAFLPPMAENEAL